jgi:hypothetical protein
MTLNQMKEINNINNIIVYKTMTTKDYKKFNYNSRTLFKIHLEFLQNFYEFEITKKTGEEKAEFKME